MNNLNPKNDIIEAVNALNSLTITRCTRTDRIIEPCIPLQYPTGKGEGLELTNYPRKFSTLGENFTSFFRFGLPEPVIATVDETDSIVVSELAEVSSTQRRCQGEKFEMRGEPRLSSTLHCVIVDIYPSRHLPTYLLLSSSFVNTTREFEHTQL